MSDAKECCYVGCDKPATREVFGFVNKGPGEPLGCYAYCCAPHAAEHLEGGHRDGWFDLVIRDLAEVARHERLVKAAQAFVDAPVTEHRAVRYGDQELAAFDALRAALDGEQG